MEYVARNGRIAASNWLNRSSASFLACPTCFLPLAWPMLSERGLHESKGSLLVAVTRLLFWCGRAVNCQPFEEAPEISSYTRMDRNVVFAMALLLRCSTSRVSGTSRVSRSGIERPIERIE